ncbi:hypothetical protein ACTFIY_010525 [Dictyostelium cf. discoideum]
MIKKGKIIEKIKFKNLYGEKTTVVDVDSMSLNGEIYSNTPFTQFIGKFCFNNNGGFIIADIIWDHYNISSSRLFLFSDSIENVIEKVESLSCNNTVTPTHMFKIKSNDSNFFKVKGQGDSYWYLVIQICEIYPSNLKYEVSLYNEGYSYFKFLSADHQSVPKVHLFYYLLNMVLILFSVLWMSKSFKKNELNDWVIENLNHIMYLSSISLFLYLLNWVYLILDLPPFKYNFGIANWIYILSKNLFFLLLIYVGQRWTTSIYYKSKIRNYINLFLIVINFSLEWSLSYTFDYSKPDIKPFNYYYFNYLPGYFWYVSNVSITVYFIYCNIISYRSLKDDEVIAKTFLKYFTLVFSIYMLSPILVVVISHFFPEYIKLTVSTIMNHTVDFIFYITLMVFFRPTSGNILVTKYFRLFFISLAPFDGDRDNDDVGPNWRYNTPDVSSTYEFEWHDKQSVLFVN